MSWSDQQGFQKLLLKCMPCLPSDVLSTGTGDHQDLVAISTSPEQIPLLLAQASSVHSQHNLPLFLEAGHYPPTAPLIRLRPLSLTTKYGLWEHWGKQEV